MVHYLNVCDVSGSDVEPVDIITFGSPCQDLSIAGKQKGLSGNRSGLFMEAVRIIKEMRESTGGEYPKYALWENVPGAFSSNKGEDFGTVIEELCRICDETVSIPRPTKQKWRTAGTVVGDGWSVAWRVLDAKYHGVPQRRRRIFLVTDFTGERAAEVLFKQESLPGNSEEGFGSREGTTGCITKSTGSTICLNDQGGSVMSLSEDVAGTLRAQEHNHQPHVLQPFGICSDKSNSMLSDNPHSGIYNAEVSRTIDTNGGNPACNQGGIAVVIIKNENCIDCTDATACNEKERKEGESYTFNTVDRCAVIFENHPTDCRIKIEEDGTTQTLTARMGTGGGNQPLVMELPECDQWNTLTAKNGTNLIESKESIYTMTTGSFSEIHKDQSATLMARDYKDAQIVNQPTFAVRRITPTECQRLQGFPENWAYLSNISDMTDEEYNFWTDVRKEYAKVNGKKFTNKSKEQTIKWYNKLHTDSSEYKMWGNGVALPCVLVPISEMAKRGCKTLGSLFDGSGGFPLAGVICGIKPLWCSEIEPYPIAVTKSRFG